MMRTLISAVVLHLSTAQFCPSGYDDFLRGTPCDNTNTCARLSNNPSYNCVNGYCCKNRNFCNVDEISISGSCYKRVNDGELCTYTAQCQGAGSVCQNGICHDPMFDYDNPTCRNPNNQLEQENGIVKSCLYERCSYGFKCEYHSIYQGGQYICCGSYEPETDYNYGIVRLYPGTNLPLQCFAVNSCLWMDTPNCVYSKRYGHSVCCSTFNC